MNVTATTLPLVVEAMAHASSLQYLRANGELLIVYDLETTGLDPKKNQILTMHFHVLTRASELKSPLEFGSTVRMQPDRFEWTTKAFGINRLDPLEMQKECHLPIEEVMPKLYEWLRSVYLETHAKMVTLVAYSGRHFDTRFLKQALILAKLPGCPGWLSYSDALNVLTQLLPPGWKGLENQKLLTVFQSLTPFRIDEKEAHSAKVDTLMLAAVLYAAQVSQGDQPGTEQTTLSRATGVLGVDPGGQSEFIIGTCHA